MTRLQQLHDLIYSPSEGQEATAEDIREYMSLNSLESEKQAIREQTGEQAEQARVASLRGVGRIAEALGRQ